MAERRHTDLVVTVKPDPSGAVRVALFGELDISTAAEFDAHIPEMLQPGRSVVIDMAGISFLDSTGIRSLLLAKREMESNNVSVALRNWPPRVLRVIEAAGLVGVLGVDEPS